MTYMERATIQPGWMVWTSDGKELGKVIGVTEETLRVKKQGLLGGEVSVPKDAVSEVETGRVELGLTRDEALAER